MVSDASLCPESGAGHRSVDNMFINLMQAIYLTDEEFEAELEKRRGKLLTEGGTDIGCITCGRGEAPATAGGGQ